jgi:enamine deaminase RidA (YjgF/YER057c/UK114 family)
VFIAGQEPEYARGNLVGPGDLAAQARQVFANLGRALTAAGARPGQVAEITIYVVHHRPEHLPVIELARAGLFGDHNPADTVVGVQTLARPEYLIEVDAIAVIDRSRHVRSSPGAARRIGVRQIGLLCAAPAATSQSS